jgi:lactoylglutathione lyase
MNVNYAIVFVSDMNRSIAFYRDVMGLPLKFETPQWTEFATGGATLALHIVDGPGGPPDASEAAGRCRTGVGVVDLDAFHQRMIDHGVPCLQPPTLTFGARIAQYADPDGMVFSVSDRP